MTFENPLPQEFYLGRDISSQEVRDLETWLRSLPEMDDMLKWRDTFPWLMEEEMVLKYGREWRTWKSDDIFNEAEDLKEYYGEFILNEFCRRVVGGLHITIAKKLLTVVCKERIERYVTTDAGNDLPEATYCDYSIEWLLNPDCIFQRCEQIIRVYQENNQQGKSVDEMGKQLKQTIGQLEATLSLPAEIAMENVAHIVSQHKTDDADSETKPRGAIEYINDLLNQDVPDDVILEQIRHFIQEKPFLPHVHGHE